MNIFYRSKHSLVVFFMAALLLSVCEQPGGITPHVPKIDIDSRDSLEKIGRVPAYPLMASYTLTADLTLENWTPIGTRSAPFSGSFNGGGHAIRLRSFTSESLAGQYIGIFGYTNGAVIRDLTVSASLSGLTGTAAGTVYAGTLIAYANDTALDHITATGALGFASAGGLSIGGIAGYHNGSASSTEAGNHIKNSVSSVAVTGTAAGLCSAGGINGTARYLVAAGCRSTGTVLSTGTVWNDSSGGISGDAQRSVYTDCVYAGGTVQVSGTGGMPYAGGIVGRSGANSAGIGNMLLRCSSGGAVFAASSNPSDQYPYAGGLIGYMHGNSVISQSYSTAAVSGDGSGAYIGGLAGNCSQTSLIENSYFNGTINHGGTATGIGGITGQNGAVGSIVRYSYAAGTITSTNSPAGGIVGQNYNASGNDVKGCAALQSAITVSSGSPHRIAGTTGRNAALTNNIANSSMTGVAPGATGADTLDGADCVEKPAQSVYEGLWWDFVSVWKMGANGYPALRWQP
jgi:hypothetical protein